MQIRIYQDGTFESLSAAVKTEFATLKADLKTITKVEGLRVKREAAKKAGNALKDKAFLAEIKKLKATLSSNRNSSVAIVREKIAKLSKAATAPKLTKGNKTGDPRRNPTRLKSAPKEQLAARQRKAVHAPKKPTYAPSTVTKDRKAHSDKIHELIGYPKGAGLTATEKKDVKEYIKLGSAHNILRHLETQPPAKARSAGKVIGAGLGQSERDEVRTAFRAYRKRENAAIMGSKPDGGKKQNKALDMLIKDLNKGDKLHGIVGSDRRKAFELAAGIIDTDNAINKRPS